MGKHTLTLSCAVFILIMAAITAWQFLTLPPQTPLAVKGVLDLRSWDPESLPEVALNGQWEFFPGQLAASDLGGPALWRQVPDLWTGNEAGDQPGQGQGTYRLTVLLPDKTPPLALRWTTISTAARFSVNGQVVASSGHPAFTANEDQPQYQPQVARFTPPGKVFVLTVQVSNHEYRSGGLWREVQLGTAESLEQHRLGDIVAAFVLATLVLAMAISSLFHAFQRHRREYLFFALFALIIALRYLVTGDYFILALFPHLGYEVLIRLENASIALLFEAFVFYVISLLGNPRRPMVTLTLLLIPQVIFLALALGAPLPLLTQSMLPLIALMVLQLGVLLAQIWWPAFRGGKTAPQIILAGVLLLVIASIHDIGIALTRQIMWSFLPGAFLIFLVLQLAMMAGLFNQRQRRQEALVTDLSRLLLNSQTVVTLFANHQGLVVKASETALPLLGHHIENQPLDQILTGFPDLKKNWEAMKADLQWRTNLPGTVGAGRFRIHIQPHENHLEEFNGAVIRIAPESTFDESMVVYGLSIREREVAELACDGLDTKQIADALFISVSTVKNHLHSLYKKTGTAGRSDLVRVLLHKKSEKIDS